MTAPVNPEGQTAQEVREALTWLVEVIEKAGLLNLSNGVHLGQTSWFVKASDALEFAKRALASTPSPARQTEQKIASAEGAASQLGAAPETVEVTVFSGVEGPCIAIGGYRVAGPKPWGGGKVLHHWKASVADLQKAVPLAPAQPDARDAEIARLTRELAEAKFSPLGDNHHNAAKCPHCGDPLRAAQAEAARLTKELEEARLTLAARVNDIEMQRREFDGAKEQWRRTVCADRARADAAEAQAKALREALENARTELRNGFIACPQCGHEEPTSDLDVLTVYIEPALAPPEPKAETPAETPAPDFLKGWLAGREAAAAFAGEAWRELMAPSKISSEFFARRILALVPPAETAGQKEGA